MSKVRPVQLKDSKRIWEIRNHPAMRMVSNNQSEISWRSHQPWFVNQYFADRNNHCYVLDNAGYVIGYCRFDDTDKEYIVSIAVDPAHHGQGFGHVLLSESIRLFNPDKMIVAQVKKVNEPSRKLFFKSDFVEFRDDKESFYLKYEPT